MRKLTSEEVEMLTLEEGGLVDGQEWVLVEEVEGSHRRWSTGIKTIFETPSGEFVSLKWDRGNTEVQEHGFWAQTPKKVKKVPVTTYVWREVSE